MNQQKATETTRKAKSVFSPWYYNKFFKYSFGALLILTIFLILYQVATILTPIFNFISILFIPIVMSFFLYHLLRPIIYLFEKFKMHRVFGILITYLIIAILLVIFFAYLFPLLAEQITAIANTSIQTIEKLKHQSTTISLPAGLSFNLEGEIEHRMLNVIQEATAVLSKNFVDIVGYITRITTVLAVTPFIVFYLLKDDEDFASGFLRYVPEEFGREVRKIIKNIDETLSSYINGLVIIAFSVGSMLFIGYLIIGLKYALILSVMALVLTTIPYLGPFLSIMPAILVGVSDSPFMVLKVVIVFVIVQQIESNIISPQVIGQKLHIHPLTIILLLLAAGSLYGLVGLLLATPFYAVFKVLAQNLYKIYLLRYSKIQEKLSNP